MAFEPLEWIFIHQLIYFLGIHIIKQGFKRLAADSKAHVKI